MATRAPLVDAYSSLRHYADHLLPVWLALPEERRGRWYGPQALWDSGGLIGPLGSADPNPDRPMLVAGLADGQKFSHRPVIVLEHGAGQSYAGDPASASHGSYSGGDGWDHAIGFLCPSPEVAARWMARYPDKIAAAIGSPKLDQWHDFTLPRTLKPVVAFTWHWDCPLIPETRSALQHYLKDLPAACAALRALGFGIAGHAHPRWRGSLNRRWAEMSVPVVKDFDDVMATASVLVADNTSAMYEFAALDRPVVVLNAPWYRRGVEHGMRFWSAVPGREVETPMSLVSAITNAIDGDGFEERRRDVVRRVYGEFDGFAASRAAAAVQVMIDR